jgi:hypothetical protein
VRELLARQEVALGKGAHEALPGTRIVAALGEDLRLAHKDDRRVTRVVGPRRERVQGVRVEGTRLLSAIVKQELVAMEAQQHGAHLLHTSGARHGGGKRQARWERCIRPPDEALSALTHVANLF